MQKSHILSYFVVISHILFQYPSCLLWHLGKSYDFPSANEQPWWIWIKKWHVVVLYIHNKTKHNKTMYTFNKIYNNFWVTADKAPVIDVCRLLQCLHIQTDLISFPLPRCGAFLTLIHWGMLTHTCISELNFNEHIFSRFVVILNSWKIPWFWKILNLI